MQQLFIWLFNNNNNVGFKQMCLAHDNLPSTKDENALKTNSDRK